MTENRYWIFTFGVGQTTAQGKKLGGYYVKIYADNFMTARKIMFKHYGDRWAFQYDNEEDAGVKEYDLKLLKTFKKTK